jgi:4-hydroxybutyrate dehydrogenase
MGTVPPIKIKTLIAVPTTCGTGSEVTNIAIAELKSLGIKKGIAVDQTFADIAVLIPEMLGGLPYSVFVTSSVDALIHTIESFLSPKASDFTELYSREAARMIMQSYKMIAEKGEDARFEFSKEFLIASCYAGIAFGNAGCAAVHALAYSIGGAFHVPHGEANYQFFTAVMKLYAKKNPDGKIRKLTELLADVLGLDPTETGAVYDAFDAFLGKLIERKPLREYGMTEAQIDEFTKSTVENQQRLLANNYVFIEEDEFREIFAELY